MNSKLELFNFKGNQVRTVIKEGEPWWVLTDLCKMLELSNATVAAKRLEQDERSKFNLGRQGDALIVNEFGLYRLMFRSDKKEAQPFIRWITHEVIPQIRKTGGYSKPNVEIKLTTEQRLKAGEAIAQCPLQNLHALLDVFRPLLSHETFVCYKHFPKVPIALPDGGYYMPPKENRDIKEK